MAKVANQFLCSDCGETFSRWQGKCGNCGAWNTLKEFRESQIASKSGALAAGTNLVEKKENAQPIKSLERFSAGYDEVDRVLGGGFFPGSLILFGGSPGVGKSTLALQIFLKHKNALYFSGEESVEQVAGRASRLGAIDSSERIVSSNAMEDLITTVEKNKPELLIVDSIQMVGLAGSALGQIGTIRENAEILLKLAKNSGTTIVLIGHVTKADEIAGPKILEHIVDVVLQLEGDNVSDLRLLRSSKNRFGSTLEVGVFTMEGTGMRELTTPSEFFLSQRAEHATGSAITVVREGARNFLLGIQALTVKSNFGQPRRTSHGIDLSKLHLLLAVISKFTPFHCESVDAYLNVVGGLRIKEPAADLAIIAAVLSSRAEKEIASDTIILGEVGLCGEVRSVAQIEARLREAHKLGFTRAITPKLGKKVRVEGLNIQEIRNVGELVKALFG